jgi:hypothetical protein
MTDEMPKIRAWQSAGVTHEAAQIGFDILRTLAHAKEPLTPTQIRESVRPGTGMIGTADALVQNMLRIQHKLGNIQSTSRVNRLTLALDRPRFSITEPGLDILGERRQRSEILKMAIPKKRKNR